MPALQECPRREPRAARASRRMTRRFYVYVYFDPETALPFYVGKGQGRRAYKHFHQCHNAPMADKLARLAAAGQSPRIEIQPADSEADALRREADLIATYGRRDEGGFLFNVLAAGEATTGFRGHNHTPESRVRISAALKGRPKHPGHGPAVSRARKGKPVIPNQAAQEKSRQTRRGMEYRQKVSARVKEQMTPDKIAQLTEAARVANKGRKHSPEHVAKRVAAAKRNREAQRAAQSSDA